MLSEIHDPSRVLKKLRAGDFVKTAGISRVPEPWLTEVVGRIGYDLIWFDMEHRPYGYDRIDPLSLACRATGIDLMVRICKSGYFSAMQALEFGANGIMVPHCRSAQEARQWVEWVRFPPVGKRGLDGVGADADFGLADTKSIWSMPTRRSSSRFRSKTRKRWMRSTRSPRFPGTICCSSVQAI